MIFSLLDVSGGYNPSMLAAMRDAITASKTHSIHKRGSKDYKHLCFEEAFQLATLGGSQGMMHASSVGYFATAFQSYSQFSRHFSLSVYPFIHLDIY